MTDAAPRRYATAMEAVDAFGLFLEGETVADPGTVSPDLEYMAYPEEWDFEWRMVDLPIEAFGCDLSFAPTIGCTEAEEAERFERIRGWIADSGGVERALQSHPIVATIRDGGLNLVDGRHRAALARAAGCTHVRTMVGIPPDWTPCPSLGP